MDTIRPGTWDCAVSTFFKKHRGTTAMKEDTMLYWCCHEIRTLDNIAEGLEACLEHSDNEVRQRIPVVVSHLADASRILSEIRKSIEHELEWRKMEDRR
jgi:hypothetical protein